MNLKLLIPLLILGDSMKDIKHSIGASAEVNFIYDTSLPANTVYWNTALTYSSYKIYKTAKENDIETGPVKILISYNLLDNTVVSSVKTTVKTIFDGYIIDPDGPVCFKKKPSPTTELPTWATYNPEKECFVFSADLFFNVTVDTSSIPECSYRTLPQIDKQKSEHYQYANYSRNAVCSHPKLQQNGLVKQCAYVGSFSSRVQQCEGYEKDQKDIALVNLIHKTSGNSFDIKAVLFRSIDGGYKVDITNTTTNTLMYRLDYDSIVFSNNKELHEEIIGQMAQLLSLYESDHQISYLYDILKDNVNTVSVNIKPKNSYISSLLSKDPNVCTNSNNQLLQTV